MGWTPDNSGSNLKGGTTPGGRSVTWKALITVHIPMIDKRLDLFAKLTPFYLFKLIRSTTSP